MTRFPSPLKALLVVLFVLMASGPAQATWYWTHGHSGHVEDLTGVTSVVPTGTGLKIDLAFDGSAWVHYALPTIGESTQGARYLKIRFCIENALNSWISDVYVYNGDILVKKFPVVLGSAGCQTTTFDLGQVRSFPRSLGVSIKINSGPDSGIDEFLIVGVGANFVAK